jgi:putative AlgH/UPF0301 family transcriptional regulator
MGIEILLHLIAKNLTRVAFVVGFGGWRSDQLEDE